MGRFMVAALRIPLMISLFWVVSLLMSAILSFFAGVLESGF
jgi:hypothetical protein